MLNWLQGFIWHSSDSLSKDLKSILGFTPNKIYYYHQAFSHRSIDDLRYGNNERLEFLGDSILESVITEYLFNKLPEKPEGVLSDIRSKIVSRKTLNQIAKKLQLEKFIKANIDGEIPESVYGNCFEALIAAIYIDKGRVGCEKFIITKIIEPFFSLGDLEKEIRSYKKHFIHWAQKSRTTFSFDLISESGSSHQKKFTIGLFINKKKIAQATCLSKKKAEELVAKTAYKRLNITNKI